MRAPFQILGIPYRISSEGPLFCVLHRSDEDVWQFVAGGGEEKETPLEAARREIFEETGVSCGEIIQLTSLAYVPADCISARHRRHWPADT
ncbi:MAG: NUDIX domain-containing protein, partial [Methanocorpusculum sp.]|nr:NUDIX domain-containing protein [Methanocorpusculum sp.]